MNKLYFVLATTNKVIYNYTLIANMILHIYGNAKRLHPHVSKDITHHQEYILYKNTKTKLKIIYVPVSSN